MKILYLTNIYPDIRSTKIINSLIDYGYKVDVVTLGMDSRKQGPRANENLEVFSLGKYSKKYYLPLHPVYWKKIITFMKGKKYNLIIQRDIFQTFNAILIKKLFNINNSIIDIADNYPETIDNNSLQSHLIKKVLNTLEALSVKNNNLVLTVTDASAQYLKKKHSVSFSNYTLHNYPSSIPKINFEKKNFSPSLVYIGSYDIGIRNIEEIFRYKDNLIKEYSDFKLYIHSFDYEKIYDIAKKYKMVDYIHNGGIIDYEDLHQVLSNYSIGLIPHVRSKGTDYTEPNKLYDYLQSYLPIIASDNPSLIESIVDRKVGFCYSNGSDFIEKMKCLEKNYINTRKNIKGEINMFEWDEDFRYLIDYIEEVTR